MKEKCYSCQGKGFYTQIHGIHGAEDFGGDGFNTLPTTHEYPCSACAGTGLKKVSPMPDTKTTMEERLLEKMAAIEHERWAKWQKYMHSRILPTEHDSLMQIGSEWVERWNRQINTPYSELSEAEKESDREQVRPYLALLTEERRLAQKELLQEFYDECVLHTPLKLSETSQSDYDKGYIFYQDMVLASLKQIQNRLSLTNLSKDK